ncbi:hypothetical protein D0862_10532 [Hortaea werneckii]|uniref:Zn(2)-C6 fungal-type domain-containing protein n=1 Tax=Hortaea werneckii TaxID=91943 RepID=A0A3M7FHD0_HORWE|nr:hypothetical protein D0862_10532 [Hortaea werneckii]
MDVSTMLHNGALDAGGSADGRTHSRPCQDRNHATTQQQPSFPANPYTSNVSRAIRHDNIAATGTAYPRASPTKKDQKHVVFQLIDPEDPRIQARLPMRVMISPHDNTESIITTVKNFYGLYDYGVSFENKEGISIIAAYDNFEQDMTVFVRTVAQPASIKADAVRNSISPQKAPLGAPFEMRAPHHSTANSPSRTAARSAGLRSMSPQSELGRRSTSAAPGARARSHRAKSKDNSVVGDADGYSSDENGEGSVTSSRRSKQEQVNAEISVDNIVEGGRRKRAFESSELPLFVPPQVPMTASISSISPQRRSGPGNAASPYGYPHQSTFSSTQPLPSPQSYGSNGHYMPPGATSNGFSGNSQVGRSSVRRSGGSTQRHSGGVLPTPDPTVGSVISDEDVALQLMRLGDPTAFSHGRTSTSTVDDALSGKAEAASSDEEDEEEEEDSRLPAVPRFNDVGPQRKKQRTVHEYSSDVASSDDYEDRRDTTFDDLDSKAGGMRKPHTTKPKNPTTKPRNAAGASMPKPKHHKTASMSHHSTITKLPMSPSSLPAQSRKGSLASASTINFQHPLGLDEEDLSSKPRCQRCRKSKKGCDRQRPCGRCRDAGIGVEGCISEDEGNGRKGRYGRHMGVPIKRDGEGFPPVAGGGGVGGEVLGSSSHHQLHQSNGVPANGYFLAPALPDKSKKRKR